MTPRVELSVISPRDAAEAARQQAEQRQRRRGLAAARLAGQAERLAAAQRGS